eukprot:gb/GEZN01014522.1/.p1 GENE.gb/GEZN01014522.1/~~gb/GEZN01014522.1/.p1  ORF type:complete len:212 (+),score=14.55 gb/GEZN01014522.1/:48-683(+)
MSSGDPTALIVAVTVGALTVVIIAMGVVAFYSRLQARQNRAHLADDSLFRVDLETSGAEATDEVPLQIEAKENSETVDQESSRQQTELSEMPKTFSAEEIKIWKEKAEIGRIRPRDFVHDSTDDGAHIADESPTRTAIIWPSPPVGENGTETHIELTEASGEHESQLTHPASQLLPKPERYIATSPKPELYSDRDSPSASPKSASSPSRSR